MTEEKSGQAETGETHGAGAMDKIRDILFGTEMQGYENRFKVLEERITTANQRVISEMNTRLNDLEASVARQLARLDEKRESEKAECVDAIAGQEKKMQDCLKALRQSIDQIEHQYAKEYLALTQLVHNQGNELVANLDQTNEELNASLVRESQRLQNISVTRNELAGVFEEFSARLQKSSPETSADD